MTNNRHGFAPIIIIIAVALAAALGGYIVLSKKSFNPGGGIACTMEAKLCPDGTAVGRTGPNCEFAECPEPCRGAECPEPCRGAACPIATSTQGAFCGGIAPGAFPCPDGYTCKLDGTYPDAGGHCVASPAITVLSPNGGEVWQIGKTYNIRYQIQNKPTLKIENWKVIVKLVADPKTCELDIEKVIGNHYLKEDNGLIEWTVPDDSAFQKCKQYLVAASLADITSGGMTEGVIEYKDSSDAPFSIVAMDSASNWLAYINTKYIFGFKYPEGKVPYIAVDKENKILLPAGANAERIVLAEDEAQIFSGIPKTLAFDVIKEDISNENWLAGNLQKYISSSGLVSQKNIQFHGRSAVEVIGSGSGGSAYKLILVKPGNYSIAIVLSAKSELLDSVLQTFTFDVQSLK